MLKKFICSLILLNSLLLLCQQQQREIDSLLIVVKNKTQDTSYVKNLILIGKKYIVVGKLKQATIYTSMAMNSAKLISYKKGILNAYLNFNWIQSYSSNYDSAMTFLKKAVIYCDTIKDKYELATIYNSLGNIYLHTGNFQNALSNYLHALSLMRKINNKKGIAYCINNIGITYYKNKQYKKSLENYLWALQLFEEIDDMHSYGTCYDNISIIYTQNKNYDSALYFSIKAIKIHEKTGNKEGLINALLNRGDIYANKKNYSEVIKNFEKALKLSYEIDDKRHIAFSLYNIGYYYFVLNQPEQSTTYLTNALKTSLIIGDKEILRNTYQILSEVSEKKKDYKQALTYQKLFFAINDSIFNNENSKKISEMNVKYETEKKEKELEIKKLEINEKNAKIKQDQSEKKLLTIILVSISLIFAISFYFYRVFQLSKRKQVELSAQKKATTSVVEALEKERTRIAQDLHDGAAQTLASVILKIRSVVNTEKISDVNSVVNPVLNILLDTHKEIRSISHQMMPRGLSDGDFLTAISELLTNMFSNTGINYNLETLGNVNIPQEPIKICIYRILQELTGNIIKHAQATEVSIQLLHTATQIILIVEDNGMGILNNSNNTKNGIGMQNINARVHMVSGSFSFEPGPFKGMIANIRIPLIDKMV